MVEDEHTRSYYTNKLLFIIKDELRNCDEYEEVIYSPFIIDNISEIYRVFKDDYKIFEEDKYHTFRT